MKLIKSPVIYDREEHTYTLDGVLLQGLTGFIKEQLFPDMYSGISSNTLNTAAQRGSEIHDAIEDYDNFGAISEEYQNEVSNYIEMSRDNLLKYESSEYVVSYDNFLASPIDKVYRVSDNEFILGDIKTVYRIDQQYHWYVTWQLNVYKVLFERQNPDAKVVGLCCLWLRGDKSKFIPCEFIPENEVWKFIHCCESGIKYDCPPQYLPPKKDLVNKGEVMAVPHEVQMLETAILEMHEYESKFKEIKSRIKQMMIDNKVPSWSFGQVRLNVTFAKETEVFDEKKFKEENPDIWKKYLKPKKGSDTFKITIKN